MCAVNNNQKWLEVFKLNRVGDGVGSDWETDHILIDLKAIVS